ncbi:MAG: 50S ribosomal protein L23 [Candidatus Omnitrophica bacterium]|nr:50S ribosomal protein L23 [Candidatus Omnitrophota bacterium]
MKSPYQIIKALLRTEKSTTQEPMQKYLFLVDIKANKPEIKKAVQEIYKVKVKKVNTYVLPGKLRRIRYQLGKTPDYKRAVVTLVKGQRIEVG